ncbi:DUF6527 family protein [Shimia sp. FJ5]|uniref:DUF6527 family protein n=1 Tax=Shimia sp. FJ5 TaxID=3079054 RepID=UPI00293DAD11|nr:DUF6527 family protein [Shimia sp. FJ5]MDV4146480.1 DUF6527 family protein [Shimia sp. FJ5]
MIIVRDGVDKWACFHCPSGCGETIKLSLSKNRMPRWTAMSDWLRRPTISPSVRQTNECRCHFWIRCGRIDWCRDSPRHELHSTDRAKLDFVRNGRWF